MKSSRKPFIYIICVIMVLCVSVSAFVGCAKGSDVYDVVKNTKKDNFTLLNESAKKGQIVLIGDSIIEIFPTEMLDIEGKIVYNRGISGDHSNRMCERLDDNALNISPSTVFILVGTNDLALAREPQEIVSYINMAVSKCKDSGVENVVVSSLLPVKKSINANMVGIRKNSDIVSVNEYLKQTCETQGVIYADTYSSVVDENGEFDENYTYDGLHPNAKGYQKICEVIAPLL
ncbi:MAG: hypothetical protein K2J89_01545 [Clostridia bacterium]|nr:hypothetical protein [Clostridia bacterium]